MLTPAREARVAWGSGGGAHGAELQCLHLLQGLRGGLSCAITRLMGVEED